MCRQLGVHCWKHLVVGLGKTHYGYELVSEKGVGAGFGFREDSLRKSCDNFLFAILLITVCAGTSKRCCDCKNDGG